jgi:hypothetical protein
MENTISDNRIIDSSMPSIVVTRPMIGICHMCICTTISPDRKSEINDELKKQGLAYSGTQSGWMLDESYGPVPCEKYKDRWHYICVC